MSDGGKIVIVKQDQPSPTTVTVSEPPSKGRTTLKKPLKSILKVKGVADPAKSPPLKKTAKRRRVQILTDRGSRKHRRTIRRALDKMSTKQVRTLAEKHGLVKGKNTPPQLTRELLEGGITAGFVSID